jgi:hypothetical protein
MRPKFQTFTTISLHRGSAKKSEASGVPQDFLGAQRVPRREKG